MKNNLNFLFFIMFIFSACAKPTYVNSTEDSTNSTKSESATTACEAKFTSSQCISMSWSTKPTDAESGSFKFKIYRINLGDGSPVPVDPADVTLNVVLWMPSMGHGSSPVQLKKLDVGTYEVTDVFFIMRGAWEIRFQLKNGKTIEDQATIPFNF